VNCELRENGQHSCCVLFVFVCVLWICGIHICYACNVMRKGGTGCCWLLVWVVCCVCRGCCSTAGQCQCGSSQSSGGSRRQIFFFWDKSHPNYLSILLLLIFPSFSSYVNMQMLEMNYADYEENKKKKQ